MAENRAKLTATSLSEGLAVTVRVLLAHRGMTQRDLVRATSRSDAYWSKRLNGQLGFTLADVEQLSVAFRLAPEDLMRHATREAGRIASGTPATDADWWAITTR